MKILLGGLHQEINSFAPGRTTIAEYKRKQCYFGQEMLDYAAVHPRCNEGADGLASSFRVLRDAGAQIIWGGFMSAQPGSIIEQPVLDYYIEEIKKAARENLPLDGVVLFMHGAAQSEQSDDPEGDIVLAVREIVGEDVPITVGLDLHANISERMV